MRTWGSPLKFALAEAWRQHYAKDEPRAGADFQVVPGDVGQRRGHPVEIINRFRAELYKWFNEHGGYHEDADEGMCADEASSLVADLADDLDRDFGIGRGPWTDPQPGDVLRVIVKSGPQVEVLSVADGLVTTRFTASTGESHEGTEARLAWITRAGRHMKVGGCQYIRKGVSE